MVQGWVGEAVFLNISGVFGNDFSHMFSFLSCPAKASMTFNLNRLSFLETTRHVIILPLP